MIFWHIVAIIIIFGLGYFFGREKTTQYYKIKCEELEERYKYEQNDREYPARMQ